MTKVDQKPTTGGDNDALLLLQKFLEENNIRIVAAPSPTPPTRLTNGQWLMNEPVMYVFFDKPLDTKEEVSS